MASLEDVLQCAICLERMKQPKMLQCQHTFCKTCLENMDGYGSITCPECRNFHYLHGEGVNGLPNNLTIIKLLDVPTGKTKNIRIVKKSFQDWRTKRTRAELSSLQYDEMLSDFIEKHFEKMRIVFSILAFVGAVVVGTVLVVACIIPPAKLSVVKKITDNIIVQGMNLTIEYNLRITGMSAATDVLLNDSTFPENDFQLVAGTFSVKWPKILPGTNVTHVVVVRPLKSGKYNFTSAVVQYFAFEGATSASFVFSNDIGEVLILTDKEYQTGMFVAFFIISGLCVFLWLWLSSNQQLWLWLSLNQQRVHGG